MDQLYAAFLQTFALTKMDIPMIFVGLVLFYALYRTLEVQLFLPYLEHLEYRERETVGALETAALLKQKANALQERYDSKIFESRVEANRKRIEIVESAKAEAADLVAQSEKVVAKILDEGRSEIAVQLEACRAHSRMESESLATMLVQKVDEHLSTH